MSLNLKESVTYLGAEEPPSAPLLTGSQRWGLCISTQCEQSEMFFSHISKTYRQP